MQRLEGQKREKKVPTENIRSRKAYARKGKRSRAGILTTAAEARKMILYKEIMSPPKGKRGLPPVYGN